MYKLTEILYDEKGKITGYILDGSEKIGVEKGMLLARDGKIENGILGVDECGNRVVHMI